MTGTSSTSDTAAQRRSSPFRLVESTFREAIGDVALVDPGADPGAEEELWRSGWGKTYDVGVTVWPVMLQPLVPRMPTNSPDPGSAYWQDPPILPRERAIETFDELAVSLAEAPRHPEACVATLTDPSDWLINNPRLRVRPTSGLVMPRLTRIRFERTCYDYDTNSEWFEGTVLATPIGDLRVTVKFGWLPHGIAYLGIVAEDDPLGHDPTAANALHQRLLRIIDRG